MAKMPEKQLPSKLLPHKPHKTRSALKTVLKLIIIASFTCLTIMLCQFLLGFLFRWLYQITNVSQAALQTCYSAASYVLALIILIFLPARLKKHWQTSKSELGVISLPTWTDLGLAPVGFIVYIIIAAIVTALFSLFPWFNAAEAQDVGFNTFLYGGDRFLAFFTLVVVAPIAEELIFRGYLYGKLKKHLHFRREIISIVIASLITSLAFAVLHGQWNVAVNVFVMSLVLCALREITGTIYSGIIMHMIKNVIAFVYVFIISVGGI